MSSSIGTFTVAEYVTELEARGFRFRACRRANRPELLTTFPVIWPAAGGSIAAEFGTGRDAEVFEFVAERDGVTDLPPITEVVRPSFASRPRRVNRGLSI